MNLYLAAAALAAIFLVGMSFRGVRGVGSVLIIAAAAPIAVILWALFNVSFG